MMAIFALRVKQHKMLNISVFLFLFRKFDFMVNSVCTFMYEFVMVYIIVSRNN